MGMRAGGGGGGGSGEIIRYREQPHDDHHHHHHHDHQGPDTYLPTQSHLDYTYYGEDEEDEDQQDYDEHHDADLEDAMSSKNPVEDTCQGNTTAGNDDDPSCHHAPNEEGGQFAFRTDDKQEPSPAPLQTPIENGTNDEDDSILFSSEDSA
jgi:hypothetical protein